MDRAGDRGGEHGGVLAFGIQPPGARDGIGISPHACSVLPAEAPASSRRTVTPTRTPPFTESGVVAVTERVCGVTGLAARARRPIMWL